MKRWLFVLMLIAAAAAAFANPGRFPGPHHRGMLAPGGDPELLRQELEAILAASGSRTLGDLSVEELHDLLGQISVARQKAAFVNHSRAMSFMLPGLGQFANHDPVSGSLFLSADLLVKAGTLVGAYVLLPEELQFGQLHYFTDSYSLIRDRWEGQSFVDLLPAMGVLAGGWLVEEGLKYFASRHAERLARRNIAEGTLRFEPQLYLLPARPGNMGMGMNMRY
jgi:hypothetical protein